jgi:hypothetical protein
LRESSLLNETARTLGFKRTGENIMDSLRSVYEKASADGLLALEEGLVILVGTINGRT